MDAQTTGIWIWLRRHPRDEDLVVCFADTEGLDTPHISQSYNWMLSSLALLISNVFLYQSKNSIDSRSLITNSLEWLLRLICYQRLCLCVSGSSDIRGSVCASLARSLARVL
jgi:hypothetical protein